MIPILPTSRTKTNYLDMSNERTGLGDATSESGRSTPPAGETPSVRLQPIAPAHEGRVMLMDDAYWESQASMGAELPLRKKVCGDCAVKCGLYTSLSNGLRTCSDELRIRVSRRWFCHNDPGKACMGNAANQGREILLQLR